jgi:hypothetical protein
MIIWRCKYERSLGVGEMNVDTGSLDSRFAWKQWQNTFPSTNNVALCLVQEVMTRDQLWQRKYIKSRAIIPRLTVTLNITSEPSLCPH